jgi:CDP-glycerol glycerophosphotransferase (TagB/SpsB family)
VFVFLAYKMFLKKRKKEIVGFASTYFKGNIKYLYQEMKDYEDVKVYFVTGDREELNRLRSYNVNAYYFMDIMRIPLFLKTKVWVTSTSPGHIPFLGRGYVFFSKHRILNILSGHFFWMKVHESKWVDVWHDFGFKNVGRAKMLRDYNVGFVNSTFFKQYYSSKERGISDKLKITGYPRIDPLITKAWDREKILKELGIPLNKKNILYAPTRGHEKGKRFFPWGSMNSIIDAIEGFCKRNNCSFFIRMHTWWYMSERNIVQKKKLEERVKQSKHLFHLPANKYVETQRILFVSDVLITDWSSIVNDFILLDRPVIFLDVELPVQEFKLTPEDRVGYVVKGKREFFEKLQEAIDYPKLFEKKRRALIKKVYSHLNGNSSRRCAQEIMKLLKERNCKLVY